MNEKTINYLNQVIEATGCKGTYDEITLRNELERYWNACRLRIISPSDVEVQIYLPIYEKNLIKWGFDKEGLEDVCFDAAFQGMQELAKL